MGRFPAWAVGHALIALLAALALFGSAATARAASPQRSEAPTGTLTVLDVPYLSQRPELCGGAAAAMVLRYWGLPGVRDTDFAALVDSAASGIRAADLVADLMARGYRVLLPHPNTLTSAIRRGRPPIALIEVAPRLTHYVVVVASTSEIVLYHDPAVAPFQLMQREEFERRWTAAGGWMAVVMPSDADDRDVEAAKSDDRPAVGVAAATGADRPRPEEGLVEHCEAMVLDGIRMARAGDLGPARATLVGAALRCPDASAPWRELAGTYFVEEAWGAAVRYAGIAVDRDPADNHAWRMLATSLYLNGEEDAALEAWNRIDAPRLDLISIPEPRHVTRPIAEKRLGLVPGQLLTPRSLRLAGRRLASLPVASASRVSYEPLAEDWARVVASFAPQTMTGANWGSAVRIGMGALTDRELQVRFPGFSGRGELIEGAWRFQRNRPALALGVRTPEPIGLRGVLEVDARWDTQSYAVLSTATVRETLRGGSAQFGRWTGPDTRLIVGFAVERWNSRDLDLVLSAGAEQRMAGDHGRVELRGDAAIPVGSGSPYQRASLRTQWRTTSVRSAPGLYVDAGATVTGTAAPYGRWPGAGAGLGRPELLRAHPLLDDGVIVNGAFGRALARAAVEARAFPLRMAAVSLGAALFIDGARVWYRLDGSNESYVDAGLGLRFAIPGSIDSLRIDWAHGLLDGRSALSIGWTRDFE